MTTAMATTPTPTSTRERRIVVAEELGYCWGVRRALDIIQDAADPERRLSSIGDVIHNPQVVERLRAQGVEGLPDFDEAMRAGFKRIAITAHGYGPQLAEQAAAHNVELIDSTCPLVTKVQRLAQKLARQGYYIVVYGDAYHPEVRGVLAWSGTSKAKAAKKLADLGWNARRGETGEGKVSPPRKVALVSQTTKNVEDLMKFARELEALVIPEGGEFRFINTICEPTSERQNALRRLIERDQCDLI
jgi:4-hydroxy-3-methylbut-2-enyl diphosphate reductase